MPSTTTKAMNWGEVDEKDTNDDNGEGEAHDLPPSETIVEGEEKRVIRYVKNKDGKIEKHTKFYRLEKHKQTVSKSVLERRKLAKFGDSEGLPPGPDTGVTGVGEEVYLVLKSKQEIQDTSEADKGESVTEKLKGKRMVSCRICKGDHWTTKCPYKDNITLQDGAQPEGEAGAGGAAAGGDAPERPAARGGRSGGYVPPALRSQDGSRRSVGADDRRDDPTVRVTNLSENTREEDLRALFRPFGPVNRCYLATDRQTGVARGFGFVSYVRKEDAQSAIDHLNGYGYDHLILQVEWANPPSKN